LSLLLFSLSSINIENIIFIITSVIDIIAVSIIAISVIQIIYIFLKHNRKSFQLLQQRQSSSISNLNNIKRNFFISGLLLALEFEAANAILKMGVFTSIVIDKSSTSTSTTISDNFMNKFIIFILVLSIRIAINQSLRRFNKNV
jgi:uncharacterized membrane protein